MAFQPSSDQINNLIAFTEVGYEQATVLLRKHNGNVELAANDWFDNGERSLNWPPPTEQWTNMDNAPTFRIDATDTANSSVRGAISRPPSRASYQPTGEIVDLSEQHAAADPSKLSLQDDDANDADLQRALAMSRESMTSSQTFSPQENGVTTGTGQQFGPAQENKHYEPSQWQMTTVPQSSVKEVLEHPRPSKRRKISGEPAFLRGGAASGYLGPVLTIYHAIPLAREALLFPQLEVHAYGHDPNWWSGVSDENYKSASVTNGALSPDLNNYLCEIQSLMGFLDSTQRSYGSVDALADLNAYKYFNGTNDFDKLLAIWERATMAHSPEERLTQVYTSVAMKDTNQPNTPPITKPFQCLDPPVQSIAGAERTLYAVLDGAIWGDETSDSLDDVWLHYCAPILTLRLFDQTAQHTRQGTNHTGLNVRIPAILYADRYIEENREESWKIRQQAKDFYRKVQHLSIQQESLRRANLARNNAGEGSQVEIHHVLQAARDSIEVAKRGPAFLPNGIHSDDLEVQPLLEDNGGTGLTLAQLQQCANELEAIMEAIQRKLDRLEEQKNKIREEFRKLGLWMTAPVAGPAKSPHKKYYLSGVTTKPWITYVRVKQEKDLIEFEEQEDVMTTETEQTEADTPDEAAKGGDANWQWWRVSFSRDEASPSREPVSFHPPLIGPTTQQEAYIADKARQVGQQQGDAVGFSVKKISEDEVLKAAREESTQVIAVYASEEAIHFKGSELSESLQAFVERDNKSFELELRVERRNEIEEESTITTGPSLPIHTDKGEHAFDQIFLRPDVPYAPAEQSLSSPPTHLPPVPPSDTLRSDLSPTSTIQNDNNSTAPGREMTPMSVSSPKRENDSNEEDIDLTQGSPKRPRSADAPLVDVNPLTAFEQIPLPTNDDQHHTLPSHAQQLAGGAEVDTPTVGASSSVSDSDVDSDLDVDHAAGEGRQMEERKIPRKAVPMGGNKIGLAAERMMERYGHGDDVAGGGGAGAEKRDEGGAGEGEEEGLEIEHPHEPLR